MKTRIEAYRELSELLRENELSMTDSEDIQLRRNVEGTLERLTLSDRFKMKLRGCNGSYEVEGAYDDWTRLLFMDGEERTISWSDDDRQPKNEWLFTVCFPAGPYIFGPDYPKETFKGFFNELKSYGPKYCDTANKALYFTEDNAYLVHKALKGIMEKHRALVAAEVKEKRKKELEAELANLNK